MNQLEAFRETVRLAEKYGMPALPGSELGLEHLRHMAITVETEDFSEAKLGRWLGWAQCALVSANMGVTLADMKKLNKKWAADAAQEPAISGYDDDPGKHSPRGCQCVCHTSDTKVVTHNGEACCESPVERGVPRITWTHEVDGLMECPDDGQLSATHCVHDGYLRPIG